MQVMDKIFIVKHVRNKSSVKGNHKWHNLQIHLFTKLIWEMNKEKNNCNNLIFMHGLANYNILFMN